MNNRFKTIPRNKTIRIVQQVIQTPKGTRVSHVLQKPKLAKKDRRRKPLAPQEIRREIPFSDLDAWSTWADENPLPAFEPEVEDAATTSSNSQHYYMEEWLPRRENFVRKITLRESLSEGGICFYCQQPESNWRCLDCFGTHALCRICCRKSHSQLPFHRIQFWTGNHYQVDWLYNLGVVINLGHKGSPCPWLDDGLVSVLSSPTSLDTASFVNDRINIYESPSGVRDQPAECTSVIIGHSNGVHKVWIRICRCQEGAIEDQFLLEGLYPASFKRVETAFTFDLLDLFRLENLECKTSAYHTYHKLRRLTCPLFPNAVPDRYRELYRVSRQWRNIKHWKWGGVAYNGHPPETPGDLALFCPACPQPGINTPSQWKSDPDPVVYTRSFVMDGNFSAVHQKRQNAAPEICLTKGNLFMVEETKYKCHLASAIEAKEPSTCNEHHAVNDKFIKHKGQDVTGIGATACARHGAFCPSGVVNFQKGERQMNMDYSVCHGVATSNVGDISNIILLYDINCQFHINFLRRVQTGSPYLSYPINKKTYYGIGAFHVSGHIPKCFPRYSSQFIPGAGITAGEILETLWAVLNEVSPSAQTTTLSARRELLDDHMLDSNWKKLLGIVSSVCQKYVQAVKGAKESMEYFQELVPDAPKQVIQEWESQVSKAQIDRLQKPDAMDIFDVQGEHAPTWAEKQLELVKEESRAVHLIGCTAWIAEGLKIQEAQLLLASETRKRQKKITPEEELALSKKRHALDLRIEKHQDEAEKYLPSTAVDDIPDSDEDSADDRWEDDEDADSEDGHPSKDVPTFTFSSMLQSQEDLLAEKKSLFLPSTLGYDKCSKLKLHNLAKKEIALREGQANDALHGIRMAIGEKSFCFRTQLRNADSKTKKTRSWDLIHAATKKLQQNRIIYQKARQAMISLKAPDKILDKYKVLTNKDLRTSTAVQEPNARGQQNEELSWIWKVPGLDLGNKNFLRELMRVNWIQAKSRQDRWKEELSITSHEMVWILLWLQYKVQQWMDRAQESPQLSAYAYRQANNWKKLKWFASGMFHKTHKTLPDVFGYDDIFP